MSEIPLKWQERVEALWNFKIFVQGWMSDCDSRIEALERRPNKQTQRCAGYHNGLLARLAALEAQAWRCADPSTHNLHNGPEFFCRPAPPLASSQQEEKRGQGPSDSMVGTRSPDSGGADRQGDSGRLVEDTHPFVPLTDSPKQEEAWMRKVERKGPMFCKHYGVLYCPDCGSDVQLPKPPDPPAASGEVQMDRCATCRHVHRFDGGPLCGAPIGPGLQICACMGERFAPKPASPAPETFPLANGNCTAPGCYDHFHDPRCAAAGRPDERAEGRRIRRWKLQRLGSETYVAFGPWLPPGGTAEVIEESAVRARLDAPCPNCGAKRG